MPVPSLNASIEELIANAQPAPGATPSTLESLESQPTEMPLETGRSIITYAPDQQAAALARMAFSDEMRVASAGDFEGGEINFAALGDATVLVFPEIGVALAVAQPEQTPVLEAMAADESVPVLAIEAETLVFETQGQFANTPNHTWGLVATGADLSNLDGRNIKIAILDTGVDQNHPDFAGRTLVSASFIPGETIQDMRGHGTHCLGTAMGPRTAPGGVPRYGVASAARIYAGKVLSNAGPSVGGSVLAGMNWTVLNRCEVVSMSLGGPGGPYAAYTQAGQQALNAGCLFIAAAGNDSRRPAYVAPVNAPANSPTIVSVGALDSSLALASFSCGGGKVDIAGPGVSIFSSWLMPQRYNTISGTSMATPHVAGIAALIAGSSPAFRGAALRAELMRLARALPLPAGDVGAGLVHC